MREKKIYRLSKEEKAQSQLEYALQLIVAQAKENGWKQIGFTTSSKNERPLKRLVERVSELGEKDGIKSKVIETLSQFPQNVFEAETCDIIIFIERYSYSYYSELDVCLRLLKKHEVSVLGVITYR